MKYITLTVFLFLTLVASAQLTMEEIAYIPSPSGYYNNLVVKGNVNIKNLETAPLNVQSYGSFLNMEVKSKKGTQISTITVLTDTSIALNDMPKEKNPDIPTPTRVNVTAGNAAISFQVDTLKPEKDELDLHQVKIGENTEAPYWGTGGNYWAYIRNWTVNENKRINIRGEKLNFEQQYSTNPTEEQNTFITNMTFIYGMRVPYCGTPERGAFTWKTVSVGDKPLQILACDTSAQH